MNTKKGRSKKQPSNGFVSDRMYELCLPRLQRYEYGKTTVGNSHHVAQLMSYYATMASVSHQQWRIVRLLHEKRTATSAQIAKKLNLSQKLVSAQLGKLKGLHLVDGPRERGGSWSINSFIEKE